MHYLSLIHVCLFTFFFVSHMFCICLYLWTFFFFLIVAGDFNHTDFKIALQTFHHIYTTITNSRWPSMPLFWLGTSYFPVCSANLLPADTRDQNISETECGQMKQLCRTVWGWRDRQMIGMLPPHRTPYILRNLQCSHHQMCDYVVITKITSFSNQKTWMNVERTKMCFGQVTRKHITVPEQDWKLASRKQSTLISKD